LTATPRASSAREIDKRYRAACAIARAAGKVMLRHFRKGIRFTFKGPQDFLTAADREVERLVIRRLSKAFPGDDFIGEEGGGSAGARTWVIDPIDGTANFARGVPHFCISLAYLDGDDVAIGVIYDPVLDELFAARAGKGAIVNGRKMRVSGEKNLKRATIELGWSPRRPARIYAATLSRVLAAGASFRRSGSGALGMAYVADGRSDGYFEAHINAWDVLAGLLMVREAGGWTNDFLADDGLRRGNFILACTPALRAPLQKLTRPALATHNRASKIAPAKRPPQG
jgi:myo-inositol-1(or 4)-monophosphatase